MDRTLSQRRLVKKVGGAFTVLRQDSVRFNTNQTYRLSVTVNGSAITVSIDGVTFYSGTDSSHAGGTVGFYTWRNSSATFDNVIVRGIVPTASTLELPIALDEPAPLFAQFVPGAWSRLAQNTAQTQIHNLSEDIVMDNWPYAGLPFPPLRSGGGPGWGSLLSANASIGAGADSMTRSLQ